MIDDNITQIRTFEDLIQDLTYSLGVMNNKLAVLSNPLLEIENDNEVKDFEQLQEAVNKYISKIIVNKIGFSRYKLVYHFLDGVIISGCFYSVNKKLEFYDIHDE